MSLREAAQAARDAIRAYGNVPTEPADAHRRGETRAQMMIANALVMLDSALAAHPEEQPASREGEKEASGLGRELRQCLEPWRESGDHLFFGFQLGLIRRAADALSGTPQPNGPEVVRQLLVWARERKDDETLHRPDVNIYKRTLEETWDQVIRRLESMAFGVSGTPAPSVTQEELEWLENEAGRASDRCDAPDCPDCSNARQARSLLSKLASKES